MEESVTYQAILRKGRLDGARKFLLLIGEDKLGPPDEAALETINAVEKERRLEQLAKRVNHVNSWAELLAMPAPRRRRR